MAKIGAAYSYPLLKVNEIINCLKAMQLNISQDELRNPNGVQIKKVFEVFMEMILMMDKDEMAQASFSGLNVLQYPELYEESIPEMTYFKGVSKMMLACGFPDFSIRDVIHPDAKRLRKMLSALINFAKFRSERLGAFASLTRHTEDLVEQRSKAEVENEQLQRQLEELRGQRNAEEPERKRLQQSCEGLEREIDMFNKKQAVLKNESGELKAKWNSLKDEAATKQFQIVDLKQESQKLSNLVVHSPERVKKNIQRASENVEVAMKELQFSARDERSMRTYADSINRSCKEMKKVLQQLQDIATDALKCKAATRSVKEKLRRVEELQLSIENASAQKSRLDKTIKQKQDQIVHQDHEYVQKLRAAEKAIELAKEELHTYESKHESTTARIEQLDAYLHSLREKELAAEQQHEQQIGEVKEMYSHVFEKVRCYNQSIVQVLENVK